MRRDWVTEWWGDRVTGRGGMGWFWLICRGNLLVTKSLCFIITKSHCLKVSWSQFLPVPKSHSPIVTLSQLSSLPSICAYFVRATQDALEWALSQSPTVTKSLCLNLPLSLRAQDACIFIIIKRPELIPGLLIGAPAGLLYLTTYAHMSSWTQWRIHNTIKID